MRVHGYIPASIGVVRVTPETVHQTDTIVIPNYWHGISESLTADVEAQLVSWLTETDSWSPNARMFGEDDMHDQLSIWRDDSGKLERINILISLSNPDPDNLAHLFAFPALNDCFLHGIQSELVYEPTRENFLSDIRSCSAFRFLRGREYYDAGDFG